MTDQKQGSTSGKPNKFNEQNKNSQDRKAVDNARQSEPSKGPTTETNKPSETAAQKQ
jgi:hypothetical protein